MNLGQKDEGQLVDTINRVEKQGAVAFQKLMAQLHDTSWYNRMGKGRVICLVRQLLAELKVVRSNHLFDDLGIIISGMETAIYDELRSNQSNIPIEDFKLYDLPQADYNNLELIEAQLPDLYQQINQANQSLIEHADKRKQCMLDNSWVSAMN